MLYQENRAWLEISLKNLESNVKNIISIDKTTQFMAIVKANAYGMGDIRISQFLNSIGITCFGVATIEEAKILKEHGIKGEILVLGYTPIKSIPLLREYDLIQSIVDLKYAKLLNDFGGEIRTHLKIDTGMNRMGIGFERFDEVDEIFALRNLRIEGIYTHLCVADSNKEQDIAFTHQQLARFEKVILYLKDKGVSTKIHFNSSYGFLNRYKIIVPENYIRVGIAMYGAVSKDNQFMIDGKINLELIFKLKARISTVKKVKAGEYVGYGRTYKASTDRIIAGVTIGYADGIPRNMKGGKVIVNGHFAPIIGRICMDQMMIDVTDIEEVSAGDSVVLIGKDDNGNEIDISDFSSWCNTIPNEILSRIGDRVTRVYLD